NFFASAMSASSGFGGGITLSGGVAAEPVSEPVPTTGSGGLLGWPHAAAANRSAVVSLVVNTAGLYDGVQIFRRTALLAGSTGHEARTHRDCRHRHARRL